MDPFEPIDEIASDIEEEFSQEIAPIRYHKFLSNLREGGIISKDIRVFVVYGLRRMGKTFASVMLAKKAQEYGYESYYYEVLPDDEYFNPRTAGNLGRKLKDYVLKGKKLFLVIDEAFRRPIITRRRFIEPFRVPYLRGKEFFIILTGSYVYDVRNLTYEISRVFMKQERKSFPTIPRTAKIEVYEPYVPEIYDFFASNKLIELGPVIEFLKERDFIYRDKLSGKALELFNVYRETYGIPSSLMGREEGDKAIDQIIDTLKRSFDEAMLGEKIDRSIRPKKIKFGEFINKISELLNKHRLTDDPVERLAINTNLLLPAVRISGKEPLTDLIVKYENRIKADLYSGLEIEARPSSLLAYEIFRRLGISMPKGYREESIVANALLTHALYYDNFYKDALMTNFPIFTYRSIDFVYKFNDKLYLIEVKKSLSDAETIIKTIDVASREGLVPIILVPYEQLESIGTVNYVYPASRKVPGMSFKYRNTEGSAIYTGRALEFVENHLVGKEFIRPIIRPIELFFLLFGIPRVFSQTA